MPRDDNAAGLERARRAWNAGDLDGYLEFYAEDIRLHGYSPESMDKAGVRVFYRQIFEAFHDPKLTFHELLWEGERVCIRFTVSGRHEGTFMGIAPTGRAISFDGITILHLRDGRCYERWASADMLGLFVQLGAVSLPGETAEAPTAPGASDVYVDAPTAH